MLAKIPPQDPYDSRKIVIANLAFPKEASANRSVINTSTDQKACPRNDPGIALSAEKKRTELLTEIVNMPFTHCDVANAAPGRQLRYPRTVCYVEHGLRSVMLSIPVDHQPAPSIEVSFRDGKVRDCQLLTTKVFADIKKGVQRLEGEYVAGRLNEEMWRVARERYLEIDQAVDMGSLEGCLDRDRHMVATSPLGVENV